MRTPSTRFAGAEPVEILLVEDHPGDARLTIEALRDAKILNRLHVVPDGNEALAFLRRQGPYAGARPPDLVLLDLSLPGLHGSEVLRQIKGDPALRDLAVVIVTASPDEADAARTLEQGAAGYATKPVDFAQLARIIQSDSNLWLSIVESPRASEAGVDEPVPVPSSPPR
jgi:two-component system, chemotaxis family, response regulator Rcp1